VLSQTGGTQERSRDPLTTLQLHPRNPLSVNLRAALEPDLHNIPFPRARHFAMHVLHATTEQRHPSLSWLHNHPLLKLPARHVVVKHSLAPRALLPLIHQVNDRGEEVIRRPAQVVGVHLAGEIGADVLVQLPANGLQRFGVEVLLQQRFHDPRALPHVQKIAKFVGTLQNVSGENVVENDPAALQRTVTATPGFEFRDVPERVGDEGLDPEEVFFGILARHIREDGGVDPRGVVVKEHAAAFLMFAARR